MRRRQVHLDFHTSPLITNIGERFDKHDFQKKLKNAHVDSITVFAKCHHSLCYYPTKVGEMHPHLKFDLTGEMVSAAHEIGVKAPVYIPIGWSAKDADDHPEWCVRDINGNLDNYPLIPDRSKMMPYTLWKRLCVNTGYGDHVLALTDEICQKFDDLDGMFFDICFIWDKCYCVSCRKKMEALGIDIYDEEQVKKYYEGIWKDFAKKIRDIIKKYHPEATCFFNGGALMRKRQYHRLNTHIEMEDLPTAWGGYDAMPLRAKYFGRIGKEYLGMTGSFHRSWGEFGGFKHPDALTYEVVAMMMYGAGCSVGTQMHPCGKLDESTFSIIGKAYEYAEKIEDYCFDIQETADLGFVLSDDMESNEGVAKMLLESSVDFAVICEKDDLSRYKAIVLPDCVKISDEFAQKLEEYIRDGGALLVSGESTLNEKKDAFMLDIGVDYAGPSCYEHDFVLSERAYFDNSLHSPFLMYSSAVRVFPRGKVLASIQEPFFNRTYDHYCSHGPAPYVLQKAEYPGMVQYGKVIYIAHHIGKIYNAYGARVHREYFMDALNRIYPSRVLEVSLPSNARVCMNEQESRNRYVMHITYAIPVLRGNTQVVEDFPEIREITVKFHTQKKILRVSGIKNGAIKFTQNGDKVTFVIPKVKMHEMIVLEY